MSKQLSLFTDRLETPSRHDLTNLIKARKLDEFWDKIPSHPIGFKLRMIATTLFELDFVKLYDDFGYTGVMEYFDFTVKGINFKLVGDGSKVRLNGRTVFVWREKDAYNQKTSEKIRDAAINYLLANQYQFGL